MHELIRDLKSSLGALLPGVILEVVSIMGVDASRGEGLVWKPV